MDMSVATTGTASAAQSSALSNWQQRQQGFKDLTSALQSGDLASAQKAFAALDNGNGNSNSPLAKIGQALKNGDLAGAQQAMQAMKASHGGHHHHHGAQPTAAAAPAASPAPTSVGTQVNTSA
jgi:hypothetical protein